MFAILFMSGAVTFVGMCLGAVHWRDSLEIQALCLLLAAGAAAWLCLLALYRGSLTGAATWIVMAIMMHKLSEPGARQ